MDIVLKPIGTVKTEREEAFDDYWGSVTSTIHLDDAMFTPEVTMGLHEFSHLEVVYFFHKVVDSKVELSARHPRNNAEWPKVGIFSQRAKGRPNRLAVSVCRLLKIEGLTLTVESLDAIDGTPVIDIKPYMKEFAPRGEVYQPLWSTELMKDYFKK
ncbi:SAM-dependent methyltransferase [Bacillus timonensis]|nr:SAM-dependent methyltransferase [Bacillus timonensis]